MQQTILVFAECRDGQLRRVAFEALQAARVLAGSDGSVHALLCASAAARVDLAKALAARGADVVHIADAAQPSSSPAEYFHAALSAAADLIKPQTVLMGHTALGRELAPRLAAAKGAGHIADATAMEIDSAGEGVSFIRPIYAGKAFEHRRFQTNELRIVTIRPNNFPAAEASDSAEADSFTIQTFAFEPPTLHTIISEVVRRANGQLDLSEADVVVAGGRGVRSADGFKPLQELADALGGAVGASRAACDAGYCDYALQIGQTGKVVTPTLYIACGISGAIQHLAGMSQSRTIIAINKDPDAPIFSVADYGIVGDLFEVVPILTEEILKLKAASF